MTTTGQADAVRSEALSAAMRVAFRAGRAEVSVIVDAVLDVAARARLKAEAEREHPAG